jgi:stage V sporulation protein K
MAHRIEPPHLAPQSREEVLHWVEAGRLAADEAIGYLQHWNQQPVARPPQRSERETVDQVLTELDQLIGLEPVKRVVREFLAYVDIQTLRRQSGLKTSGQMWHMVFSGAPGTGKTTVARLLGRLLGASGVLSKGHLVEVERADLVGEYIGHTAQKTRDLVKTALGGVLFIDEAYSLARGGDKDFGREAIDTLVAAMENYRDDFLLILAGYRREMAWFLASNPGLISRFPIRIEFADYAPPELVLILRHLAREREYHLTPDAETHLLDAFTELTTRWHENAGNARMMRNLLEYAIRRQAVRLTERRSLLSRHDLMTLTWQDFEGGF